MVQLSLSRFSGREEDQLAHDGHAQPRLGPELVPEDDSEGDPHAQEHEEEDHACRR